MKFLHGIFVFVFLMLFVPDAYAQTKIRGRVCDASTGEAVPFAAVFFEGTTTGTTTDVDGWYTLVTRDMTMTEITVQMLGYIKVSRTVKSGVYSEQMFFLRPEQNMLSTVTVKADNSKARALLANIDAHRSRNNPEEKPSYSCDVYSKMELDITHPREQLRGKALNRQWNFIFDYVDTSDISGVPYLPVMINESVSRRFHSANPDVDREVITATRLSGADPGDNLLAQFTGSMHLKNNFYRQYIDAFSVEIPSPINSSGLLFYNYFIVDSLDVEGRKTLLVHYHPKNNISTPSFDGEMQIDAEDFALRCVKARLVRGQNMNWIRDMVFEATYRRVDSTWFYGTDRFYADFSISLADSTKMMSFLGNRTLEYSNPDFSKIDTLAGIDKDIISKVSGNPVYVQPQAAFKDESYWASARPYPLSEKEAGIYSMVDRIQDTKLYDTLYDVVYTIINGYWDFDRIPIGIGPYLSLISFNPLEGFRMRLGVHTSVDWSRKDRLTGYVAYGVKDKTFKGGFTWEHMFSKTPTRKLTLDGHYDVVQLGKGTNKFNEGNILSSLLGGGKSQKPCLVAEGSALFEMEFNGSWNKEWLLAYREYFSNAFVPMFTPSNCLVTSIPAAIYHTALRFSHNESVTRGHFIKTYTYTKYPVLTLSIDAGGFWLKGSAPAAPSPVSPVSLLSGKSHSFFKPELAMDWNVHIPPIGRSRIHLDGGLVVGKVPYPYLHLHEGNGTFLMDKTSFSTMDYFEFASDLWTTFRWDHNFYGFFLGKIPLLKKLQLREAVILKATWGSLRSENCGNEALLLFPEGMHSFGKIPYVEAGFGISNIFRLIRVDFLWRCTHREDPRPKPRNFVVNVGLELRF